MEPLNQKEQNAVNVASMFQLDSRLNQLVQTDAKTIAVTVFITSFFAFLLVLAITSLFHFGVVSPSSIFFEVFAGIVFGELVFGAIEKFPYIKKRFTEKKALKIAKTILFEKHTAMMFIVPLTPLLYFMFINGMYAYLGVLSVLMLANLISARLAIGYTKDAIEWASNEIKKGRFDSQSDE
jgi:hypothetical protein